MGSRDLKETTRSALNVRAGEELTTALLFLYFFFIVAGTAVIGGSLSRALFLSQLPKELIPFRFIGMALGVVVASTIYARISGRYRQDRLIVGFLVLMSAGLLLFRLLLETALGDSFFILGSLFIFFIILADLSNLQFWIFASEVFNARQAKRLFGLIVSAGSVAGLAGGAVVNVLSPLIGTENLLFAVLLSTIGSIFCVLGVARANLPALEQFRKEAGPNGEDSTRSMLEDLRSVSKSRLLVMLSGIVVITVLVVSIIEYQFDLTLQKTFAGDSAGLSAFLGSFFLRANIAIIALQFLVAGRLLQRYGVIVALVFLPGGFALGSLFILVTGAALWAVVLARTADIAFRYGLNKTALNVLYLPVPASLRPRAKAIVDGVIKPGMVVLVGLLFLAVDRLGGISIAGWSVPALFFLGLWLALLVAARKEYRVALAQVLNQRRFRPEESELDISDETTIRVLKEVLEQADERRVVHAFHLIKDLPAVDWRPQIVSLLNRDSKEIRLLAIEHLGQHGDMEHSEALAPIFGAPEPKVRARAIEAYCAIQGVEALQEVLPFLYADEAQVQSGAVVGLIKYGGLDGLLHAAARLKEMLDSQRPEVRRQVPQIIGKLQVKSFYNPLLDLFDDSDVEVRSAAIVAAGEMGAPQLLRPLVNKLSERACAPAAVKALWAYGPAAAGEVVQLLADEGSDAMTRLVAVQVLERLDGRPIVQALLKQIDAPDNELRMATYRALTKIKARDEHFALPAEALERALIRELKTYYRFYVIHADLESALAGSLLGHALDTRMADGLDRILHLLELRQSGQMLTLVGQALASDQQQKRAIAIELIDTVLDRPMKELFIPLLEAPASTVLAIASERFSILSQPPEKWMAELVSADDPWLQSCALFYIGRLKLDQMASLAGRKRQSEHQLVRETAEGAWRLLSSVSPAGGYQAGRGGRPHIVGGRFDQGTKEKKEMALSTIERVLFLREVELLHEIPGEDLVELARAAEEVRFQEGETFIRQGDMGQSMYVIVDGQVDVVIEGVGRVARRESTGIIGEMAIISQQPRSADCVAITDTLALKIDHALFWEMMAHQPEIALGVIKVLSGRLDEAVSNIRKLGQGSPQS